MTQDRRGGWVLEIQCKTCSLILYRRETAQSSVRSAADALAEHVKQTEHMEQYVRRYRLTWKQPVLPAEAVV